jgi:hypothetical protein
METRVSPAVVVVVLVLVGAILVGSYFALVERPRGPAPAETVAAPALAPGSGAAPAAAPQPGKPAATKSTAPETALPTATAAVGKIKEQAAGMKPVAGVDGPPNPLPGGAR